MGAQVETGGRSRSFGRELERCLDPASLNALRRIGRLARGRAYLVGGVVRDAILRRATRDLDVVVTADVAKLARRLGGRAVFHRAFETATVTLGGEVRVDLARSRSETYAHPAALPRVRPAPIVEDLGRRDFTVNAMALRLDPDGFGRLLDPHGGLEDLEQRTIRVLHDRSFLDDPTRAYRAAGFAARLGFEIETRTRRRIRTAIRERVFERLSSARLRRELERLLGSPGRAAAVRELVSLGLLRTVDPELRGSSALYARLDRVEPSVAWFRTLPGKPAIEAWRVAFGVLLQGLPARRLPGLLERIQPGRAGRRCLGEALRGPARLSSKLERPGIRPSEVFDACRELPEEVLLLVMIVSRSRRARAAVRRYVGELAGTRPEIGGRELIAAGLSPGPAIAVGLEAALRAKLDGRAPGAKEQLRAALRAAGRA